MAARHLRHYGYQPAIYYPKRSKNELYQVRQLPFHFTAKCCKDKMHAPISSYLYMLDSHQNNVKESAVAFRIYYATKRQYSSPARWHSVLLSDHGAHPSSS